MSGGKTWDRVETWRADVRSQIIAREVERALALAARATLAATRAIAASDRAFCKPANRRSRVTSRAHRWTSGRPVRSGARLQRGPASPCSSCRLSVATRARLSRYGRTVAASDRRCGHCLPRRVQKRSGVERRRRTRSVLKGSRKGRRNFRKKARNLQTKI